MNETNVADNDNRVVEEITETKLLSSGLIISVILSVVAVAIFTWIIFSIIDPVRKLVMYSTVRILEENFFMRLVFTEELSPGNWVNGVFEFKVGFYILFPIAMICFLISGLTFLVKGNKRTRALILINWFLYLIPILSSVIVTGVSLESQLQAFLSINLDMNPAGIFRWLVLINVFIQISLLLFQEDFHQWILSPKGPNRIESTNNFRVVSFFLFYAICWSSPIVFMINFEYSFAFFAILGIGLALLTIWWAVGDSIRLILLMNKEAEEITKGISITLSIISILIGVIVLVVNIIISTSITSFYILILFFFSCILFTAGTALGSLTSKSLMGKIGYALNTICLIIIAVTYTIVISILGYSGLF